MQSYHQQPAAKRNRSSISKSKSNTNTDQGQGQNQGMARARHSGPAPGVVWVDDGKSEDLGFRSFYREDTPSPEPGPEPGLRTGLEPELDDRSSTTNIGQPVGLYDYKYYDHVAPPAPIPISAATCGITRRALLWLGLAAAAVLVTLGVGIGVGVGVAGSGHKSEG